LHIRGPRGAGGAHLDRYNRSRFARAARPRSFARFRDRRDRAARRSDVREKVDRGEVRVSGPREGPGRARV